MAASIIWSSPNLGGLGMHTSPGDSPLEASWS
jgi:hypothetical protein